MNGWQITALIVCACALIMLILLTIEGRRRG
jgi:hypothetical protein